MHRIDSYGAVVTMPAANAPGTTAGFFNNAAPGPGVTPTYSDPDWCQAVQEELVNIVSTAGISLVKGAYTQVLAALRLLFAAVAGSASQNFSVADAVSAHHAVALDQFASDGATWFKIPNASNPARPWIVQLGSTTTALPTANFSTVTITFPVTFPNNVMGAFPTYLFAATGAGVQDAVYLTALSTSSVTIALDWLQSGSNTGTATVYYIAIGN